LGLVDKKNLIPQFPKLESRLITVTELKTVSGN
jgi:hypothetical protein